MARLAPACLILALMVPTMNPAQAGPPALTPGILPPAIAANGDPAMSDTLTGTWIVTEVAEAVIPPGAPVTLEFGEGSLSGKSGCNSFSATLEVTGNDLAPGAAASTRMACGTEVMALEAAFLRALDRLTRYEIAADGTLALYGFDTLLMRATRE
jgi:heat shock protein HslJ